ncbi:cytochrome c1 [Pikeienuella piscinae]|uniref:Cytochrome c1 n=1 Tax=Pikeienuella piscinae TaxID=2748098 RepID=A0A7L5BX00_9RHOB|nr:cytochrome c1 [Pikeienuella piscinae]QIE56435.1 cytochrome c1 [Pikeienuella piscinae]
MKHVLSATVATAAALALATPAFAAGDGGHVEDIDFSFEGPFGTYDAAQLQRGFQVYYEVCSACHGLKFVSFRSLGEESGPGYPEVQQKAIAASYDVADEEGDPGDTRPGKPSDNFPANDTVGAPDLSLMAKARAGFHGPAGLGINQLLKGGGGPEYIHAILTGYTGEEKEEAGAILYENHAFPGGYLQMTPPLSAGLVEYQDGTEASVEQMSQDVAAFLMWTAEPKMTERKQAGFRNIGFLILLLVLFYFTNKKIWAPVKRKES